MMSAAAVTIFAPCPEPLTVASTGGAPWRTPPASETATVAAAPRPMTVRRGTFATDSGAGAITTVVPAKTTAPPAVPVASPADSPGFSGVLMAVV